MPSGPRTARPRATSNTAAPLVLPITSGGSSASRDHRHRDSAFARRTQFRAGAGPGGAPSHRRQDPSRRTAYNVGVAVRPRRAPDARPVPAAVASHLYGTGGGRYDVLLGA